MIMVLHGMNVVKTGGNNFFLSMFRIFVMLRDVMTKIFTMDVDTVCPGEIPTKQPPGEFQDLWREYAKSVQDLKEFESHANKETDPKDSLSVETALLIARCLMFTARKTLLDAIAGDYVPPVSMASGEKVGLNDIIKDLPFFTKYPVLKKDMTSFSDDMVLMADLEREICDLHGELQADRVDLIFIEHEEGYDKDSDPSEFVKLYDELKYDYTTILVTSEPPISSKFTVVDLKGEDLIAYQTKMKRLHEKFGLQVQLLIALCHHGLPRMNIDLKRLLVSHRRKLQNDLENLRKIPGFNIPDFDNLVKSIIADVRHFLADTGRIFETCLQYSTPVRLPGSYVDPEDGIDVHQFEWIAYDPSLPKNEVRQVLASYRVSIHAFSEQNELSTAMLQKMKSYGVNDQDLMDYMDGCKTRMRQFREISKQMRKLRKEGRIGNHGFYDFFHDMISILQGDIEQCKRCLGTRQDAAVDARKRNIEEVKRIWQEMTSHPWPNDRRERPVV
jgi:hypothetical protein